MLVGCRIILVDVQHTDDNRLYMDHSRYLLLIGSGMNSFSSFLPFRYGNPIYVICLVFLLYLVCSAQIFFCSLLSLLKCIVNYSCIHSAWIMLLVSQQTVSQHLFLVLKSITLSILDYRLPTYSLLFLSQLPFIFGSFHMSVETSVLERTLHSLLAQFVSNLKVHASKCSQKVLIK